MRIRRRDAFAVRDGVIGSFCALPPVVAVHGEIAARQRADSHASRKRRQKGRKLVLCHLRQHIAPVGERMEDDSGAGGVKTIDDRQHLVPVRMHAAAGHQPHDMHAASGLGQHRAKRRQFRMRGKRAVFHGRVDPGQVLHDHPAGPDIHVPDLGIADLPFGKPDITSRCGQPRMRPGREQRVDIRRVGKRHGIMLMAV